MGINPEFIILIGAFLASTVIVGRINKQNAVEDSAGFNALRGKIEEQDKTIQWLWSEVVELRAETALLKGERDKAWEETARMSNEIMKMRKLLELET